MEQTVQTASLPLCCEATEKESQVRGRLICRRPVKKWSLGYSKKQAQLPSPKHPSPGTQPQNPVPSTQIQGFTYINSFTPYNNPLRYYSDSHFTDEEIKSDRG